MAKYDITVKLIGTDGNAFALLGKVRRELHLAGVSNEEIRIFTEDATSGDYNHLLSTIMDWVEVK